MTRMLRKRAPLGRRVIGLASLIAISSLGATPTNSCGSGNYAQQAISEPTCGSTAPDKVFGSGEPERFDGALVNHATCRNSLIVQAAFRGAGHVEINGSTFGDFVGCGMGWTRASLWQKTGDRFVKLEDKTESFYARTNPINLAPQCRANPIKLPVPSAGEYKVVTASGVGSTPNPVTITLQPANGCVNNPGARCVIEHGPAPGITEPLCAAGVLSRPGTCQSWPDAFYAVVCEATDPKFCTHCSYPSDCGGCEHTGCQEDGDCAPGLACVAVPPCELCSPKQCERVPGCVPRENYCWTPASLATRDRAACQ
jgi:hypothetical protein